MAAHPSRKSGHVLGIGETYCSASAVGVVQQMSTAELRALVLPLGYVVTNIGDR